MKKKEFKPNEKQKDEVVEQLLNFIMGLRHNEVDQAMFNYTLDAVKGDKDFKFDKKTRERFFAWLRADEKEVKEVWNGIALKVYKKPEISEKIVDVFFDDFIDRLEKQWQKMYSDRGKYKLTKKAKS